MTRAPTADDSRPEAYNDAGVRGLEDGQAGGIRQGLSLRRKGWRKDPHGNGYLCPDASCKTSGDIHTRFHHDQWHEGVKQEFRDLYALADELRSEIRVQDETISAQSDTIDMLAAKLETHERILEQFTARGAYAIVEQVLADVAATRKGE